MPNPQLGAQKNYPALFLKGENVLTKEQRLRRATIAVVAPLHEPPPLRPQSVPSR